VLNAGYVRGATVPRVVGKNNDTVKDFRVFCAKALAGLGDLPETISSRAVKITLARRKKDEPLQRLRRRTAQAEAQPLHDTLVAWAEANVEALRNARPDVPEALGDREADIWEPLLAIADMAGGDWPGHAREAAVELRRGRAPVESVGVALLRAIADIFAGRGRPDRIFTPDLLHALVQRDDGPWPAKWGREVDQAEADGTVPRKAARALALMLEGYDIRPKQIRIGEKNGRGYELATFADAFARYVTGVTGTGDAQPAEKPLRGKGCNDRNVCNDPGEKARAVPGLDGDDDLFLRRTEYCFACERGHAGACS
jgi:hypothetical protein